MPWLCLPCLSHPVPPTALGVYPPSLHTPLCCSLPLSRLDGVPLCTRALPGGWVYFGACTFSPPSRQPTASCFPSLLHATDLAGLPTSTSRRLRRRDKSHTATCQHRSPATEALHQNQCPWGGEQGGAASPWILRLLWRKCAGGRGSLRGHKRRQNVPRSASRGPRPPAVAPSQGETLTGSHPFVHLGGANEAGRRGGKGGSLPRICRSPASPQRTRRCPGGSRGHGSWGAPLPSAAGWEGPRVSPAGGSRRGRLHGGMGGPSAQAPLLGTALGTLASRVRTPCRGGQALRSQSSSICSPVCR